MERRHDSIRRDKDRERKNNDDDEPDRRVDPVVVEGPSEELDDASTATRPEAENRRREDRDEKGERGHREVGGQLAARDGTDEPERRREQKDEQKERDLVQNEPFMKT